MLSGLSTQQKKVVVFDGNALVIACPGSGKTRVLTRKIAFEIEKLNTKKKYTLALTFTNRAADEINKRIDEMGIETEKLWAGTIHSFCLQWIIKPYSSYVSELKKGYSVADEFMVSNLKAELIEEFSLPIFTEINTTFNREGGYQNASSFIDRVAKEFHKRLLNERYVDFDLILHFSYQVIIKHPKIAEHLAKLFSYIFIDEYQDTQDLQYGIVGEIIKKSRGKCNLFLVGDPDQAIYNSLGGIAKDIREIEKEIGNYNIELLELTGNYRSTQRVIDFYRGFQTIDISVESLTNYSTEKGVLTFSKTTHHNNLYKEIAQIIDTNINNGVKASDICVIAPRWQFLISMSRNLKTLLPDVPFDAPGLTPLPRNIENFWYKLSRVFLSVPSPNMYLARIRWSRQIIDEINLLTKVSMTTDNDSCRKFLKLINSIKSEEEEGIKYLKEVFDSVFDRIGIKWNEYPTLREHWGSFFEGIERRYSSNDFTDIPNDINYFRKMFKSSEGVVVNTCHGVKGEEYETVIAFGLLWGYVPNWNSIIHRPYNHALEDSNKLLYVIGSRAKKNLHLFSEMGRVTTRSNPYEVNHQLNQVDFDFD